MLEQIPEPAPPESKEGPGRLPELARQLETTKDREAFEPLLEDFLTELESELHTPLNQDIAETYRQMEQEQLLLRVENLSRIAESISGHTPIPVGDENDHYANSVIPNNDGVRIAFAEGRAPGPVRLLIGFDVRTAISFKPESLKVFEIDHIEEDLRDTTLRKQVCRHVAGNIEPEHIKHMVLRVPRSIFPRSKLSEAEKAGSGMYIFRSIHLARDAATEHNEETERETA